MTRGLRAALAGAWPRRRARGLPVPFIAALSPGARACDDGSGGARPAGSGLRGLADRAGSAGGLLRIDSPPSSGTRLEAYLPCR